ncbi:class II histocompatibility antigen, M alpha chain [Gavia stellata]|uniref:class II histocompatibility antigen, M alpha chain n=1 Tax=Gavia stellata TaxID=37040 RepID=UPI00289FE6C7|nr:class II histocompatibility antigen, M alpha chain [Gavia stellata]
MGATGGSGVLAAGLLWVALVAAVTEEPPAHALAEVLFCQPAMPSLGLALTFDADQLFWFDFPGSRWTPRLPDLPPWPPALEPPTQLLRDATLCQDLRRALTALAAGMLPESKGIPVADVFPVQPPALGEATTLVCMVANIFPPAVEISWQLDGVPVTQGVTHTHYTPTADLTFIRFSYLSVTPAAGDIYTCIVTHEGDNASVVAYWVPPNPVTSEVLETALCGAAMALGILLALLGIAMVLAARRSAHG